MKPGFYTETIGGLTLTIADSIRGPRPWVEGIQEALAWFITLALDDQIPDVLDSIERGDDMSDGAAVSAYRPNALHHGSPGFARIQAQWKKLTGTDPGDDVYITSASFLEDRFLLPRSVLKEIFLRYLAQRTKPR